MGLREKVFLCAISLILISFLASCDMIEVHPYAGDINGKRDINIQNIARIEEAFADKDTIRFAFISDSQRWYDELEDFVHHANNRTDIDFVIHGGDLTDFGLTKEFLWQRDILEKLKYPYVAVIGNHDFLANGEDIYKIVFGEENFSFIAGRTKFVCMNTNALEANYSVPIPDFSFINAEMKKDTERFDQTIVIMHAKPTSEQFNNNVADIFHHTLKKFPNYLFAVCGHDHRFEEEDIFGDQVIYYVNPNIGKRKYLLFTVTQNNYSYELVAY